ncbi:TD and POZ domain-containing protein 3 [Nephila pilipes]|uniref:TD and POZ domain-containing protein 3 n=1 Tax=Nephila pilipes TaxID=299642 RepID=A0A8X6JKH7_NEPPI|nr:TD and POZ domain-containing protein 3 [Nephila pilipes]
MLSYIYTGKTGHLTVSLASDLLVAADKYQLKGLKTICCNYLKKTVSTNNAVKILILGDKLASDLKDYVMEFICNECDKTSVLEKLEGWKILEKRQPFLAVEVLNLIVRTLQQKITESKSQRRD